MSFARERCILVTRRDMADGFWRIPKRNGKLGSAFAFTHQNEADLRQANLLLGDPKAFPLMVKVGGRN